MKKRYLFLFLILCLILSLISGCGKSATGSKTVSTSSQNGTSNEKKGLQLVKKIEQLGNEPISNDSKPAVFEQDGYTYSVVNTYTDVPSELGSPNDLSFSVKVSVAKGNNWIVKNKVTDLTNEIWNTKSSNAKTWTSTESFIGSNLFVITNTDFAGTGQFTAQTPQTIHQIHKITFTKDGVAHYTKVLDKPETTEGNFDYNIIDSFGHPYIAEGVTDTNNATKYRILNLDGKQLFTVNNPKVNLSKNTVNTLLTLEKDNYLYFGPIDSIQAYSLEKNDLVWKSDGSENNYPIAIGSYEGYSLVKNGIYSLTKTQQSTLLTYSSLNKGTAEMKYSIQIPSSLDVQNGFVSVDGNNVYVFTFVIYKGEPAIQEYVYTRAD